MRLSKMPAAVGAALICLQANAQTPAVEFRLAGAASNPVGCSTLDASLSRVHTLTVMGERAVIKSAGGIDDTMKLTSPGVYKTVFGMGGIRLDVVADTASQPRTLTVVEAQRGCKWSAGAP